MRRLGATVQAQHQVREIRGGDHHALRSAQAVRAAQLDHPGEPLLRQVIAGGQRTAPAESLASVRERARVQLASLPPPLATLQQAAAYQVTVSATLEQLADRVDALPH